MLDETAARNETFLGLTYPKVQMLLRWDKVPEKNQDTILTFAKLAEVVKAENPKDALASFEKLIEDFLAMNAVTRERDEPTA